MQIVIETKKDCHNIQCHDLSGGTRTVSPTFEIDNNWHNVIIPTSRKNIRRILIGGVDIHMMLNSGEQNDNAYSIWLHGDIGQMKERIHDCIDQDDLLSFTNLKAKYLHTVSKGIDAPQYLPYHVRKFFSRGDGPYWFNYNNKDNLPYRAVDLSIDRVKLLASLDEDLLHTDQKFYKNANCKSLQARPELPLTPVSKIKNEYLKEFLQSVGYKNILQIQYVEMPGNSFIDIHKDDFSSATGLQYVKGPSQLYVVLKGDEHKFKMKFSRAGIIDLSKPLFINNNAFVHSLFYAGEETRGALLIYGDA